MTVFTDRADAGRRLAHRMKTHRGEDVVVLGLPRGGVVVAYEVALALGAPLDVIVVRKLGVPYQPEVAMGAIGEEGVRVVDEDTVAHAGITEDELAAIERRERALLDTRVSHYRAGRERVDLTGRLALIVDDGMATGATARAACQVARRLGAARVVVAVPVASCGAIREMTDADEVYSLAAPHPFVAVGSVYDDFSPTTDEEVVVLLDLARRRDPDQPGPVARRSTDIDVAIPVPGHTVHGELHLPSHASAVVVFAHGSGSSRHSPRNRFVASVLHRAGLGTLLMDLLSPEEELDRSTVFDVVLLANRLAAATRWLQAQPDTSTCQIGYFGASTGAAAALWAASDPTLAIAAIVSRGGRPDLAASRLGRVCAPTLLIVGGADTTVVELNREAQGLLHGPNELALVPGAMHLFEEPGALAQVALLASDWFTQHLLHARVGGSALVAR
ncbi:MAG: phosphoribosyltransferase family protein [Cellulomonas sp.]